MSENLQVKQLTTLEMVGRLKNLSATGIKRFFEFNEEQQNKVFPLWFDFSNSITSLNGSGTVENMLIWLKTQCPRKYQEFLGLDKEKQQQFLARWLKQRIVIKKTMFRQLLERSNSPSEIPSGIKSQTRDKRKAPVKKTPVAKKRKTSKSLTVTEKKALILRQQSLRLRYLFHSSECKDKKCSYKYCASLKDLWKHIRSPCNNQKCSRTHCLSSRLIVSHFKYCKEKSCKICNNSRQRHPEIYDRAKVHREAEALMFLSNSN
jgi:hypothetical protein